MTDKEKLEKAVKLADAMYYAAQYLTTDASRLRRAMDAYHQFIITEYNKQEPASEDLEKEIDRYWCSLFTNIKLKRNPDTQSRDIFIPEPPYNERGARIAYALCIDWKDERDCEGMTLTSGLIRGLAHHFAQWDREQMMKDAVEIKINRDTLYDLKPLIHERYLDYKIGDKVKVIIIKE